MKKRRSVNIGVLSLLLILAGSPFAAYAQERGGALERGATSATTSRPVEERIRERVEEHRVTLEERRARIEAARRERIQTFFNRMSRRLGAALERLAGLISRIESRIAKLEEVNKNIQTEEAKAHIENAKTHVSNGQTLLETLPAAIEGLVNAEGGFRERFTLFKELTGDTVAEIRGAHTDIVAAVRSIKAAAGATGEDASQNATTTEEE